MNGITLSMIVKNEEKFLPGCLESVKGIADQIVIVDTGSTDRTVQIAKEFGAAVFHLEWENNFSAARNFALSKSNGEWILYIDADERLDESSLKEIEKLTATDEKVGYFCTVKSLDSEQNRDNSIRYVRLFKNDSRIRFSGKVHEQIVPSLLENNYRLVHSSIVINHFGYNISPAGKRNKAERNLKLLLEEFGKSHSSYIAFQLGQSYLILDEVENAAIFFQKALGLNGLSNNLKAESYAALALIEHNKLNSQAAKEYIQKSLGLNPKSAFNHLLASKIFLRLRDVEAAKDLCKKAFVLNQQVHNGALNSEQTVYINPEEILFFGLMLSHETGDIKSARYYSSRLSGLNELYDSSIAEYFAALPCTHNNIIVDEETLSKILKTANNFNIGFLVYWGSRELNGEQQINFLGELYRKESRNIEVIKSFSLALDAIGLTEEAVGIMENELELAKSDPTALFYYASFKIKQDDYDTAISVLEAIETGFPQLEGVCEKARSIKEQLLAVKSR